MLAVQPGTRVSEFLDQALFLQIVGYVLAVMVAIHLVRREQAGDWTTLGISWDGDVRRELMTGAGFGLALLAAFFPVSFLLSGGELKVDELLRLLVGSTSGFGLVLAAVVVVIGAPIIEEIYYRGLLYEKLARRNRWVAIVVTALLFTLAHGALLIPAILLMGFGLAWQRQKHSLVYTMGAHAAWNLCVLILGLFLVLGGWGFSSPTGTYSVRFPDSWERTEIPAGAAPSGATLDVAATSSTGSFIGLATIPTIGGSAQATLERFVKTVERRGQAAGVPRTGIQGHPHLFDEGAESFQVTYGLEQDGVRFASHIFTMMRPGSPTTVMVTFVCPEASCLDDGAAVDELLHGLDFP